MDIFKYILLILVVIYNNGRLLEAADEPEPPSPLFYGWFFNQVIANSLATITKNHLEYLNGNVMSFQAFLKNAAALKDVADPLKYYSKPTDPNTGNFDPFYHITAHFCGPNKDACSSFSPKVEKFLNKNFSSQLVGVFFTPRTYGIRVNLSEEQAEIFALEETMSEDISTTADDFGEYTLPGPASNDKYPGIEFIPQDARDIHPSDTRAHVTVGCAPNVSAVVTGEDMLEILRLEQDPAGSFCQTVETDQGILVQMGDGGKNCDTFVYYLNEKMVADAAFEVYNNPSASKSVFELGSRLTFALTILNVVRKMFIF